MTDKETLIENIRKAFNGVTLDKGIGLHEAQGLDDFVDAEKLLKLRNKDEKNNWEAIPLESICKYSSSIYFFDPKGMRFHLPLFLIFDVLEKEYIAKGFISSVEMVFVLRKYVENQDKYNQFSLLNTVQIKAIVLFLVYKQNELTDNDSEYIELTKTIKLWKELLE